MEQLIPRLDCSRQCDESENSSTAASISEVWHKSFVAMERMSVKLSA